jgi:aspartate-semialdehyde dehydrogenase
VVPFISKEEDKLETEAQKILRKVDGEGTGFLEQSDLKISAACNRVLVLDGHRRVHWAMPGPPCRRNYTRMPRI